MKLLLADERPVVLAGLRLFFDTTEFEIVGEAVATTEIIDGIRRFSPQGVLLDATKTAFDAARIPEGCALIFFSPAWSRDQLLQEVRSQRFRKNDLRKNRSLTPREFDVLCGITQGLSNKEIAKTLGISVETVKEHVRNILRKTSLADRTQLALWAVRQGVIFPESGPVVPVT